MNHKHKIVLSWSEEDGVFIAEAPELPGCIAHAKTQEKALASIQDAIRLWIDVAREDGRKVPQARPLVP